MHELWNQTAWVQILIGPLHLCNLWKVLSLKCYFTKFIKENLPARKGYVVVQYPCLYFSNLCNTAGDAHDTCLSRLATKKVHLAPGVGKALERLLEEAVF